MTPNELLERTAYSPLHLQVATFRQAISVACIIAFFATLAIGYSYLFALSVFPERPLSDGFVPTIVISAYYGLVYFCNSRYRHERPSL